MSHRSPVRVSERHAFDTLIDARTPSEYALDHIPGAINCPVLEDEERRIVGTVYKQVGAFEARRIGGAMVAANLARHLREHFADRPAHWKPLVYCWRGGLRSGSMVQWLRLVGWDAQQLAGGYKAYRRHVVALLDARCPGLPVVVLCGPTGSAKTRLLAALAARGEQVLDLEALAGHRGSILGAVPGVAQPAQKRFETLLADALERVDGRRVLWVEGESPRIGRLALPLPLVARMRDAPCVELQAPPEARLAHLLRDYADLGRDRAALAALMGLLKQAQGKDTVARWQGWALAGELAPLFDELMRLHYDPHYARSQALHFARWAQRRVLAAPELSPAGIDRLAEQLVTTVRPA